MNRAVEVVAPEVAEDVDRRAVERTDAEQQRDRYAHWSRDLDGSWLLRAKLPGNAASSAMCSAAS